MSASAMHGCKLIPDRARYVGVARAQMEQEGAVGREDCGLAFPNEHRVSETHAAVKVVGRAHELRHTRHVRTAQAA